MARYAWTFAALLGLTALTLGASFLPLGALGGPAAMAIATAKSALIVLVFMHLSEARTTSKLALVIGVLLAAVLLGMSLLDVATRAPGPDAPDASGAPHGIDGSLSRRSAPAARERLLHS